MLWKVKREGGFRRFMCFKKRRFCHERETELSDNTTYFFNTTLISLEPSLLSLIALHIPVQVNVNALKRAT